MKTRVTQRGQVTIPKPLRESLGIQRGTVLEFSEDHGRLIAVKTGVVDRVGEVFECVGMRLNTNALMAELRGRRRRSKIVNRARSPR